MKVAIVSSLIAGIFTFFAAYYGVEKRFIDEIKELKGELETVRSDAKKNSDSNFQLQSDLNAKMAELKNLQNHQKELTKKYNQLIYPKEGIHFTLDIFDDKSHLSEKLKINDTIVVKLSASSINFKITRITTRGALINISGCKKYHTVNAANFEDDESTYLLIKDVPFKIIFNNKSCVSGEFLPKPEESEEFVMVMKDFEVESQTLILQYRRKLWE